MGENGADYRRRRGAYGNGAESGSGFLETGVMMASVGGDALTAPEQAGAAGAGRKQARGRRGGRPCSSKVEPSSSAYKPVAIPAPEQLLKVHHGGLVASGLAAAD